jgi:hypothetical protein
MFPAFTDFTRFTAFTRISLPCAKQNLISLALALALASAFGRNPGDDLVGVHDVAGLAVNAVGGVQHQLLAFAVVAVHHFVDVGRTKTLAGVAEFFGTAAVTNIEVGNNQV